MRASDGRSLIKGGVLLGVAVVALGLLMVAAVTGELLPGPDAAPDATTPWFEWPLDPGPSWNVPRVSLPSCLGVLPGFETEWWYYVGHAYDETGEAFSLQLQAIRWALAPDTLAWQLVLGTAGIGVRSDQSYLWSLGFGAGVALAHGGLESLVVPPVRDDAYEVVLRPWLYDLPSLPTPGDGLHVVYTGGEAVGALGSRYTVSGQGLGALRTSSSADGVPTRYSVQLSVTDLRGMVLEGSLGYVGPPKDNPWHGAATYEFAQPALLINGGTLTVGGKAHRLVRGSLWLDRQVLSNPRPEAEASRRQPATPPTRGDLLGMLGSLAATSSGSGLKPLYVGTWMGIVLDEGTSLMLASFWQEHADQWVTGTRVGKPPVDWLGNIYLRPQGAMPNGGMYLRQGMHTGEPDFDINILRPRDGGASPHWRSPGSNRTYATGWQVRFSKRLARVVPRKLFIVALVDPCENLLPDADNAFWEGAAVVYSDPELTHRIGHAFVEQMGFD